MRHQISLLLFLLPLLHPTLAAIKIASALNVIEYTPEKIAKEDFFNGTVSIVNGGVPTLFSDTSVDIASNAETQALRNYATHKNLRIIYTEAEVAYRIVGNKKSGITTAKDLKGKRIGVVSGTSAGYFVQKYMASVGVKDSEYTTVSGSVCLAEPCGSGTFPAMLKSGQVDAVGMWEPTVELAAREIGLDNAVFFQDAKVYREIFNLHTTSDKLANATKRKEIVDFIRALEKAMALFRDQPDKVYKRAADAVSMKEDILKAVWPVHTWSGTLPEDLLSVLVREDSYVADVDRRSAMSESMLKDLIDDSVLKDARAEAKNTS
ncbi:periplasmic binding protein-like II [Lindgomyces ingoldianus]|uniref:Periplasmic binding protein-like II n=1 Tax=Lindgomyces ingoldianus TaxID=673940 RepID=A0ACB6R8W3_9PLEO|nr:periplasmic binding protein-like II [Lindgomyces ingoldianus]KAF2474906.1 periplasmic binding protein-like II [Lindgomyces ingoldianus]